MTLRELILKDGALGNLQVLQVMLIHVVRIRIFTGDISNDIHSPGPVIWEVSP